MSFKNERYVNSTKFYKNSNLKMKAWINTLWLKTVYTIPYRHARNQSYLAYNVTVRVRIGFDRGLY